MAEANKTSREIARSNSCVFPRDLLQRFISNSADGDQEDEEEDEEIELNLGLSLGGRFGVDRSSKLVRSSSVVGTMPLCRENRQPEIEMKPAETWVAGLTGLTRAMSLPAESAEEEWRKRKEMQSLRRMEVKRRRNEKLRMRGGGGGGNIINSGEASNNNNNPGEASTTPRRRGRPLSGPPRWSGTANKGGLLRQHSAAAHDLMQGSLGSSSSVSELETKWHQGIIILFSSS